jgi:hypothetical protein
MTQNTDPLPEVASVRRMGGSDVAFAVGGSSSHPETGCGRAQGECCLPVHEAAQQLAREWAAAPLVPLIVAFVAVTPGCSARSVYRGIRTGTQQLRLEALELAVSQGLIRRERLQAVLGGLGRGRLMARRRLRASGWASSAPRVMGQRSPSDAMYDNRMAKTSIPQRVWWRVPEGVWPCSVCGEFLDPGIKVHRSVVRGEAFYRHPSCAGTQSS